jgi:transketolase
MVEQALVAAKLLARQGYSIRVIDAYSVKPLDTGTIGKAATETGRIISVEDHSVIGGLGSAITESLSQKGSVPILNLGAKDTVAESGSVESLYHKYGLSSGAIAKAASDFLRQQLPTSSGKEPRAHHS